MRNISDTFIERIRYHTFYVQKLFFSKIVPFMRIMMKNIVEPGRPQMTIWRMRIARWIPKAANTHSQYVMFTTIPQQQRLHERNSMLLHVHCPSCYNKRSLHISILRVPLS